MACSQAIQENIKDRGTHPTTSSFRPKRARLQIISKSRQVYDFDKICQSKDRPNANRFYQENGFGTSIIVQFIVGIKDLDTGELWNCTIRNKQRKLILDNGLFSIEVEISPNGLVCFPMIDIKQNQLPDYLGNVRCVLPVEADEPIAYSIKITLYKNDHRVKERLDSTEYTVYTHERGHDMYDYQEGRAVVEVERPQLKFKMTGFLDEDVGRELIMHFQNLGDNGFFKQFYIEQKKLLEGLAELEAQYGRGYYKDLELSIVLEESVLLFGKNKLDDCIQTASKVIEDARNLSNGPFLMGKAHTIISAVHRQRGDFDKAEEHMVYSTELLERVVVCEETAVNQYNWAALQSEREANDSLTPAEQKDLEFRIANCLLHWGQQKQNKTNRCPMRAQTRNINHHLSTTRQCFPDERKPVSEESLIKAAQAIKHVEDNLLETCTERFKVTFGIVKSDYFIRKALMNGTLYTPESKRHDAEMAESILYDTLKIAKELDCGNEVEVILDRLKNLARLQGKPWEENQQEQSEKKRKAPKEQDEDLMSDLLRQLAKVSKEQQDIGR